MSRLLKCVLIAAAFLLLSGCSSSAPDAGFVENPELLKKNEKLPFDAVWFKEGSDLRSYKKVYVAPVDTTHLLKMSWWGNLSSAQAFSSLDSKAEAGVLADYMRKEVADEFKNEKDHSYLVVEQPDHDTLIIELAIVEVVPAKPVLNAIGYIGVGALDTGTTAMEGRLRDGGSGEPVMRFKDERVGKYSIVSIADLQWYSHSKHTVEEWAEEMVKVCKKAPDESVSSPIPFTLKPW